MNDAPIRLQNYEPLGVGVGTLLAGRYDILRKIGSGGMSAVFEAVDRKLDNAKLAIKLLSPQVTADDVIKERFRQELLITRKLTHPNIVRTFDFDESTSGHCFITMELIDGTSLDKLLKGGVPLPLSDTARILFEVLKAVAYAHTNDILHRDIKPGNVLVTKSGAVRLTDFGLARSQDFEKRFTQTGECVGTPFYMAPEQIQGKEIDHRADLFAVGIIGFEMVTGRVPFAEESWYNLATKIIKEPLPEITLNRNQDSQWFKSFIRKATAKKPDERFSSAEEMLGILKEHIDLEEPLSESFSTVAPTIRQAQVREPIRFQASGNTLFRFAPFIFLGGILAMVALVAVAFTERQAKNVSNNIGESRRVVGDFVDTLRQLREAVIFTHQNKDKIDSYLKRGDGEPIDESVRPDLDLGGDAPPEESSQQ